jgi:hypothetical protein
MTQCGQYHFHILAYLPSHRKLIGCLNTIAKYKIGRLKYSVLTLPMHDSKMNMIALRMHCLAVVQTAEKTKLVFSA